MREKSDRAFHSWILKLLAKLTAGESGAAPEALPDSQALSKQDGPDEQDKTGPLDQPGGLEPQVGLDSQDGQDGQDPPCCNGSVHIAYRGVSDDRLYLAHARKWREVKFFKPIGLRVFCADCRRRLL